MTYDLNLENETQGLFGVSGIEQSLKDLEKSFNSFQRRQEKRWSSFYATHSSLQEKSLKEEKDDLFFKALRSGDFSHKSLTTCDEPGSIMVPIALQNSIEGKTEEASYFRKICQRMEVSSNRVDILTENADAEVGWVNEKGGRDETVSPDIKKLSIHINELYAKPKISQHLLDDSLWDISRWIVDKIGEQMARAENYAFLFGDGIKQPKGILTLPKITDLKKEGKKENKKEVREENLLTFKSSTLSLDPLIEALLSLPTRYLTRCTLMMSRPTFSALLHLKESGTGSYIFSPSSQEGIVGSFLGYPIVLSDDMVQYNQGKGAAILLGDFYRGYQIVDRKGLTLLRDPYSSKPYVEFYVTKRMGGCVLDPKAFRLVECDVAS